MAHNAPRCVRCWTRYCDATCQHDHWRRGHKQICKKIHRGGNAEQYYADKKYKEAVAVAVEACAEDTKGQTCYICTQALHWKTKEGLVRMCACRGTAGFAHVSCLVANNCAVTLKNLERFKEAKSLLRRQIPVARRVLGDSHDYTLTMRKVYAETLYKADGASLDDLREAVTTLEDAGRIARRVFGGAHPTTKYIEDILQKARAALNARRNPELRAAYKEDPSSLSADDRARAEQLLARDARKAAKKAARTSESA